jgi:hypothetical protein
MKKDDLIVGEDYIYFRGDNPARAYGASRYRLLSDHMVKRSKSLRGGGALLTMDIDGREITVPGAVNPAKEGTGTHLVFEQIHAKTGQPTGRITILTPAQIKFGWAEGIAAVEQANQERRDRHSEQQAKREESLALAESAESRIANLLPEADNRVTVSLLAEGEQVSLSAQTMNDLLDLAQKGKFGSL